MLVECRVIAVLATVSADDFATTPRASLHVDLQGIPGDRHYGFTRPAGAREKWYPAGTPIRSGRQITIVCADDLARVARAMEIPVIEPGWIGANLVVQGLRDLSALAWGARLVSGAFEGSGAVLVNEGYNAPCRHAGAVIAAQHPERNGLDRLFVKAARGLRGLVASVERAGPIVSGPMIVKLPQQTRIQEGLAL
jgi:MOSC domain-containing protein YiiM